MGCSQNPSSTELTKQKPHSVTSQNS